MAFTKSLKQAKKQISAQPWRQIDPILVSAVAALSLLGCLMIYSASRSRLEALGISKTYFLERQIAFVLIGFVLMALVMYVDYRKMRDVSPLLYIGVVAMLVLVLSPIGSSVNGTQGWFNLPGGFQLQPSEFSKFFIIIILASYVAANEQFHIGALLKTILIAAVPIGLVLLQPDLGTAMVLGAILIGVLSVAGTRGRYLLAMVLLAIVGVVGVLQLGVLKEYQVDRLTVFLNQSSDTGSSAYNLDQSKTAIGNGGFTGKGLFKGEQTNLSYVPEQHTDFIFTAIGEELGFIGSVTVLALFGVIAWRIWRISRAAPDATGTLICIGVVSMFVFHVFENVGMTMGIMPITGIPLPFVSYGGSAILLMFISIGLVNNIYMHRYE
ncbi:MAG TPA: rod shape-determining protein RodA [Acidimicrobiia bacterium]|nr:rod shape-determining protein RodA [Acidimicrobiia bacterium]